MNRQQHGVSDETKLDVNEALNWSRIGLGSRVS